MKSILCLPGLGTNANILRLQMKQIENSMKDKYNFIYIDPSNEFNKILLQDEGVLTLMKSPEEKIYNWGNFLKSQQTQELFARDFVRVRRILESDANIVGLIGFSQGCYLMNMIAEEIQKNKGSFLVDQIQFLIFFSANSFLSNKDHFEKYSLLSTISMHLTGPRDRCQSEALINSSRYLNPQMIEHDQGHQIPKLSNSQMRQLKSFCAGNQPRL